MNKERVVNRFLKYVSVDTQSDETTGTHPSTAKQFDLAKIVEIELMALGLENVNLDEHCYLTATLPSNTPEATEVVGFVAHFDTSPDYSGANVKPMIHRNYQGGVLKISDTTILDPKEFSFLNQLIGDDIISTDGTTLLGADNKAGVAEIMELLTYLSENPSVPHGTIRVLFTPDEEIGAGTDKVNLDHFKVDYAYTVDGGEEGEIEYENFNAASLVVKIKGKNIHPGSAKDKMVNAIVIAMDFHSMLPVAQAPHHTEGYEGFFHVNDIEGCVEQCTMKYIIRDHDMAKFEGKKKLAESVKQYLNEKYADQVVDIIVKDSYYNMKEKIEPVLYIVEQVKEAMAIVGVTPLVKPVRGGTDGARLSFMGIPTPNVFTGGYNFHGRYECLSINAMAKAVKVLIELVQIIARK
jgi:tripeptide aminopeptidase